MIKINNITKYILAGAFWVIPSYASNYPNKIKIKDKEIIYKKPKKISNIEKKVIIFDPGHGMGNAVRGIYDPGAINKNIYEENICWNEAKNLYQLSNKEKYKTIISRDRNKNKNIGDRVKLAKDSLADAFISLHINSSSNERDRGFEIIYGRNKKSFRLAKLISLELEKIPGIKRRRIRRKTFEGVLNTYKYPSVIVEAGFINNTKDLKYLTDSVPDVELAIKRGYERFFEKTKDSVKRVYSKVKGINK